MKLYTKFGDHGETALGDGTRVWKNAPRVDAYGTVDELNAVLGWCRTQAGQSDLGEPIVQIQRDLFVLGAQLAATSESNPVNERVSAIVIGAEHIRRLEQWIDQAVAAVEPLSRFVLPGGCELAARFHTARTVCRRAERAVVTLHRGEPTADEVIVYLNRLSDLLFAWARVANRQANIAEAQWRTDRP